MLRDLGDEMTNGFTALDPIAALNYGVIGLGFLLALQSFWLLNKAQRQTGIGSDISTPIYVFMVFSLLVIILGLGSEYMRYVFDKQRSELAAQFDGLKTDYAKLQSDLTVARSMQSSSNAKLSARVTAILDDFNKLSDSTETCKANAFGASTNTSNLNGCVVEAIKALHGGENALLQIQAIKDKVSALASP